MKLAKTIQSTVGFYKPRSNDKDCWKSYDVAHKCEATYLDNDLKCIISITVKIRPQDQRNSC